MVYRLIVSYDGKNYAGWQRQPNAMTVQQRLEEALGDLCAAPVTVVGSGRTDAGVHARGQVAHYYPPREFPLEAYVFATNHRLPSDIRVLGAQRMADGFHAQRSAMAKCYVYRLWRGRAVSPLDAPYVMREQQPLDVARMRQAARQLVGHHDFSAFALAGGSHRHGTRRLFAVSVDERGGEPTGSEIVLRFLGEGFLRGMVRALVGTLVEIGRGDRPAGDILRLLEPGHSRSDAGFSAEARGLCLQRVNYGPKWHPLASFWA